MRKLDKTETSVTICDMTYVKEVTETDLYNCMCLCFQFDSICVFSKFVWTSSEHTKYVRFTASVLVLYT